MNGEPVRVLLVDDHTLVRAGVRRILDAQPGVRVVAEVGDGDAALERLAAECVDVVVLDLSLPGRDGFSVLAEVRERWPDVKVVVLTMHASRAYVERAVKDGAHGYLLKDSAVQELVAAIEAVTAGEPFYGASAQRRLAEALREPGLAAGLDALTEREREVLKLVAEGEPSKQIAATLGISVRTVEAHRANLMRKLDLRSVAQLTRFALREGLLPPR